MGLESWDQTQFQSQFLQPQAKSVSSVHDQNSGAKTEARKGSLITHKSRAKGIQLPRNKRKQTNTSLLQSSHKEKHGASGQKVPSLLYTVV
jgi:hypothetical protein